jgi:hypothetical protein
VSHVALLALVFLAGTLLGIRLVAALYAPIDLWYTIRTAWPTALARVLSWSAAAAVGLLALPAGGVRGALAAGIGASFLLNVGAWFLVSRAYRGQPQPSPVVE